MADEITIIAEISLENGSVEHDYRPDAVSVNQADGKFVDKVLDIGTSEETISFDDISTKGFIMMENLDSTNYVQWGPDSTGMVTLGRINAGETAGPFRIDNGATLIMQANTATCKVRFIAYEN